MLTSRLPRLVVLGYIGVPIAKWAKRGELKRHKRHDNIRYCRSVGSVKVIEKMHDGLYAAMQCSICGEQEGMYNSEYIAVGEYVPGQSFLDRNLEKLLVLGVFSFVFVAVLSGVSLGTHGDAQMHQRLVAADKEHTYAPKEKGVQCNTLGGGDGNNDVRGWVDCEVVGKTAAGTYSVKYKEWDTKNDIGVGGFRALDMKHQ